MPALYLYENSVIAFWKICFDKLCEVGTIIVLIVLMRQESLREVDQLAWVFTAIPRWAEHLNSSNLDQSLCF